VGTFARRGLAASSLNHCGHTGPHPSHRRLLATSFYIGWPYSATIALIRNVSPRTFGISDARLVTSQSLSNSMLSETPGGRIRLVNNVLSGSPALLLTRSAHSQNSIFSGLRGRFRAHTLHLDGLATFVLLERFASGRSTNPYPGGLQGPSQL